MPLCILPLLLLFDWCTEVQLLLHLVFTLIHFDSFHCLFFFFPLHCLWPNSHQSLLRASQTLTHAHSWVTCMLMSHLRARGLPCTPLYRFSITPEGNIQMSLNHRVQFAGVLVQVVFYPQHTTHVGKYMKYVLLH